MTFYYDREPFVITVRLGYAMVGSASVFMAACAHFRMLCVQNVTDLCGIMVVEYFSAHFAPVISVKTTSLSIRHLVKF